MPTPDAPTTLPKYESVRCNENGQRLYTTPEGKFPSVTTVISGTGDKRAIEEWRESVGEKEAESTLKLACARGDATHANVENWLLNGTEPELDLLTEPYWESIKPFLSQIDKPLLIEGAVWHPAGYAGQLDCIATLTEFGDEPFLLDWKTADRPKTKDRLYDYELQAAAYVAAANHVYANLGLHIRRAKVVIAIRCEHVQVVSLEEADLLQLFVHFKARLSRFTKIQ